MHGGFLLHCEIDGDVIVAARPEIGFVHRSAEKLFEVRDYRQGAMLANRHIWTSPTAGEYAYVLAAEELLGLAVSPRADQLRLVFCEIDRILSHFAFLAPSLAATGSSPAREALADFMARATGSRMHHQVIRIGGVAVDLDGEQVEFLLAMLDGIARESEQMRASAVLDRAHGIGVLDTATIDSYGVTGPIARASGVARDERALGYGSYRDFAPAVRSGCDAHARFNLLLDEVEASCALVRTTVTELGAGELLVRTPKNLRLPEGSASRGVEGALGRNAIDIVSGAGLAPTRARLRTASFANIHALESALVGVAVSDLSLMLASWPVLAGDADR
jgi:NADH-quinone oxidoreductase subunit D